MALPYATEDQLKILERKTKAELDRKTANINLTANTMEDMNALIASGAVNDGQLCYLKEDKKLYVLKDGKWEEVGGSTSPILNLLDWSSEDPAVRTSITEEEKQNIEKGLYNSVLYIDASLGDASFYSIYFSEPASYINGMFIFSIYKFSLDETTESGSITSLRGYGLNIGEKNPDETYPITIESLMEIPFGSGSSNLPIVKKATNNKVTITEDEFDKLASGNYSLSVFSTNSSGFTSSLIFTDVAVNALSEGKPDNIRAISSSIVFNDPIIVQQDYRLNFSRNNLVSDITSSFTPMTQSKLLNKKVMTYGTFTSENLLPCTTADNGKVLSVVDGEAQWAKIDVNSYPYITGRINASDTQTSSFPKTDSETRVVTIEDLDLSKLLNTRTIIVDADADASEVFNIACGAYGETEGIGTYVSSISCDKKTNNLFFFYITMDIQTSSLIIKRKTIPTSTNTITFED